MTEQTHTNPVGRPTDYNPEFHPRDLLTLAAEGKAIVECCAIWEIAESTFFEWVKKNPEFSKCHKRARALQHRWWIERAKEGLVEQGDSNGYKRTNDRILGILSRVAYKMSDERTILIKGFAEAKTPEDKRDCLLDALACGDITAAEAERFLSVLQKSLAISEASEFGKRLAALENANDVTNGA